MIASDKVPGLGSRETVRDRFDTAVWMVMSHALRKVKTEFEDPTSENRLAYHSLTHTKGVIKRTTQILKAIQLANPKANIITPRDIGLGKIAAACHDTVQHWYVTSLADQSGVVINKRKRLFGDNERKSADVAEAYMEAVEYQLPVVFTPEDKQTVREAILLTIPTFDKELGTVTHPEFYKLKDNLVAQAVALGDLGGGGMEGARTARWEADTLFLEDNMSFTTYRNTYKTLPAGSRSMVLEEIYHKHMLAWLDSQLRFIQGRQKLLRQDVAYMKTQAQEPVMKLFSHYSHAYRSIDKLMHERKTMDFDRWMMDIDTTLHSAPSY